MRHSRTQLRRGASLSAPQEAPDDTQDEADSPTAEQLLLQTGDDPPPPEASDTREASSRAP